jgi:glyoxylase-like metal-dependent hydrolase (beta-lactamase superfamily II)
LAKLRIFTFVSSLCCAALAFLLPAQTCAEATVEKVKIADGIYQFITSPDGYVPNGNSVVIINEGDVLVFDTFTRPSTARKVLAEIRKLTPKPVRYIVNSHWHPDHWSGNEVYAREFPGLEIIATEETRQIMLNVANAWPTLYTAQLKKDQAELDKELATHQQADGTPLTAEQRAKDEALFQRGRDYVAEALQVHRTYPTLTYTDKFTLYHGGREFHFLSMVGDAAGTTVMYLPKERILATGDLLSYPVPYYTPPLSQHAHSLKTLAQFDVDVIIPGHGPAWHDKDYLNLELLLLESIVQQVAQAVQKGLVTVEEVQKAVNVEDLRPRFSHDDPDLDKKFRRFAKGMIENAYREARDGKKFEY